MKPLSFSAFAFGLLIAASAPLHAQSIAAAIPVERATAVTPAAPAKTQTPGNAGSGVPLRNGDAVEIRIANVPGDDQMQWDSFSYTIDESGMLNLPFIGLIKVAGMAPSQAQIAIQNKLIAEGIYSNPTLSINPPAGMRYITLGKGVRQPGRVPYTPDLTLTSAINSAGGPDDFAGDRIRLVHGGKVQFFSRKKLYKDPSIDPRIEPGDQIEISEPLF